MRSAKQPIVIAVDGPAASGKGTIARALAEHFGLPHMDTGMLYRAVALSMFRFGGDPGSEFEAVRACDGTAQVDPTDPELRSEIVSSIASRISAYPGVRAALLERQRSFAAGADGAVLDGRDIGTVVCPDADVKLFITAAPEERARRRHREIGSRGEDAAYETILADIRRRDERDTTRSTAPLRAAEDASTLDTTHLDADATFEAALRLIEARR
jgi:cytidylate kinase